RQQYPKAADIWRADIQRFPQSKAAAEQRLKQIVGNWGEFEPTMSQPAGQGARIDYLFRNATKARFIAVELKIPQLLEDIKSYLKSSPGQVDWRKVDIDRIGYRIVLENEQKYVGAQVAEWSLDLEPRSNHYDRRISVTTPLQRAGAYLVTAQLED